MIFWLLLPVLLPAAATARNPAAGCHCFRERTYDPARPFVADDYLLTTVFNSLIARVFDISKQRIIMMKMRGAIDGDALIVGLYAARHTGADLNLLLSIHKVGGHWSEIFSSGDFPLDKGTPLMKKIASGMGDGAAAEAVTREIIGEYFQIPKEEVNASLKRGLSPKELVFVLTMARHARRQPDEIAAMYQPDGKSWSKIAHELGLSPRDAGRLIYDAPAFGFPGS